MDGWMDGWMEQNGAGNGEWGNGGTVQGATGELQHQGTGATGNGEWKVCIIEGLHLMWVLQQHVQFYIGLCITLCKANIYIPL